MPYYVSHETFCVTQGLAMRRGSAGFQARRNNICARFTDEERRRIEECADAWFDGSLSDLLRDAALRRCDYLMRLKRDRSRPR